MSRLSTKSLPGNRISFRLKYCLLVLFMMVSFHGMSQTIDDPADGDGLVPVDGGVSLLLAAAAGLGVYRTTRKPKC